MAKLKLVTLAQLDIPAAGTRVQLSSTPIYAKEIIFDAAGGNTNNVYVGDDQVSASRAAIVLAAGERAVLDSNKSGVGLEFDLSDVYVDTDTSGNDVFVSYIKVESTGI